MHPEGPSGPSALFKSAVNDQRDPPEASYYLCLTLSECERLWAVWTVEELKSGPLGVTQRVLIVESRSSHAENSVPLPYWSTNYGLLCWQSFVSNLLHSKLLLLQNALNTSSTGLSQSSYTIFWISILYMIYFCSMPLWKISTFQHTFNESTYYGDYRF